MRKLGCTTPLGGVEGAGTLPIGDVVDRVDNIGDGDDADGVGRGDVGVVSD